MAAVTNVGVPGNVPPLDRGFTLKQDAVANDMITVSLLAGATGNAINVMNASVNRFTVGPNGALTIVEGAAADVPLNITLAAAATGDSIDVFSSAAVKIFAVDKNGALLTFKVTPVTKTTNYSVLATDSGSFFNNLGAAGSVTFTLPAVATSAGCFYVFQAAVLAQNVVITAPANTLVSFNSITSTTITLSAANRIAGGAVMVYCDGAKWYALNMLAANGDVSTAANGTSFVLS